MAPALLVAAAHVLMMAALPAAADARVQIVSYNMFWWNVRQTNRWGPLFGKLAEHRPIDLVGLQECEDMAHTLSQSGLHGFEHFSGPKPNPAPLAWNTAVFSRLGSPGTSQVGADKWGQRWVNHVRLRHTSGTQVLFANTHGPVDNCGPQLGQKWAAALHAHRQPGDVLVMTGDFNCGANTEAMRIVRQVFSEPGSHYGGIDHILTTGHKESAGSAPGWPSDHKLVKGAFHLGSGPAPQPGPQPQPCPGSWSQWRWNTDLSGPVLATHHVPGNMRHDPAAACAARCDLHLGCGGFAHFHGVCYLKPPNQQFYHNDGRIAARKC